MSTEKYAANVALMRENARKHIEAGPITETYELDKTNVIDMLNEALATEIVCVLRYRQCYYMCTGKTAEPVAQEFMEHSIQEQEHADSLATRISQLGGVPKMDPGSVNDRSHSEFIVPEDVDEMIKENLIAERVAIDSYRDMISFIGEKDPTTKRVLEQILAVEEEHADDLVDLMGL